MNISDALRNLDTLQVFSNTFTKTGSNNLTIARNLIAKTINIRNGVNVIGQLSEYDQPYSVIGDNCTLLNTTIYHGPMYYGIGLNTPAPINVDFTNSFKLNPFDYSGFYSQISGYSGFLRTQLANSTSSFSAGVYTLTGQNSINYINFTNLDIVNLQTCTAIDFNFPNDSLVVLNFYGNNTVYLNNINFQFNSNINESNVIFNFDSNGVNISGDLNGNILCTTGNIILAGATLNGSIYGNSITVTATSIINDSVIYGIDSLPTRQLNAPEIELNTDPNDDFISVIITNLESVGSIMVSVDNAPYRAYTGEFTISNVGSHTVNAYAIAPGYLDSDISTNSAIVTCTCENPTIIFNETTNTITFYSNVLDSTIYFTIDGSHPHFESTSVPNAGTYRIPHDGLYEVIAFAANGICTTSGNTHKLVLVSYPVETLTITVLATPNAQGIYPDQGGNGVPIQITKNTSSSSKIYYTTDGSDPMTNGVLYTGTFFTKNNKVLAVINDNYYGFSKIAEKDILIGGSFYLTASNSQKNSIIKSDTISNTPVYSMDIGWIGPTIIVDDTAIYQALVNILSTAIGDIPFNLSFGVSIVRSLFELLDDFNSDQIISQLKIEIEHNDPRILIDAKNSYAYFSDSTNQIVIDLAWISRYTNEKAHVKYGYNLDGIL